jgi:hypothetical protein
LGNIHVKTDFQSMGQYQIQRYLATAAANSYTGAIYSSGAEIISGFTPTAHPRENYVNANIIDPVTAVQIQIWELGNSLADIVGSMPKALSTPNDDPGKKLADCYKGGGKK